MSLHIVSKELRPFLGKCKYRECRHIDEPDCAVKQAVADGMFQSGATNHF